jgi:hypothetical protein
MEWKAPIPVSAEHFQIPSQVLNGFQGVLPALNSAQRINTAPENRSTNQHINLYQLMNKRYVASCFCLIFLLLTACKKDEFLDETQTTDLTETVVFSDSTYATSFLFGIYADLGFSSQPARFGDGFGTTSGGLDAASDEAEPRIIPSITTDIQFASGTVNPVIITADAWEIPYKNIRKVNQLLRHLPEAPVSSYRKTLYAAEARFLRAWYYSILLNHYGGIPLIGDSVYTATQPINPVRNTYEACVNYIVSECDAAALDLPIKPAGREYGRVGAGACQALKARVLLYAASPLFNGSKFAPEPLTAILGYPTADPEHWKQAAEAAKAVIALGAYSLYVNNSPEPGLGFYQLFLASDFNAFSGNILERIEGHGSGREKLWQPPSRNGGGGAYPYQEMIDAFEMKNGLPITDPASGYDPANPYANRDPRFTNSILYDQSVLKQAGVGERQPVDIYLGKYQGVLSGQDAVHAGTPTGYYTNKMLHREIAANYFIGGPQSRPLLRYAEVLLNFAEATNEYEGPTAEVYASIEAIRERAGLNPYQLQPGLSKEQMREVIRHERRIELAFEGHRFFDVRRWMIAEETQGRVMHGMEVIRNDNSVSYTPFNVRTRVFRKAMYFWPIPQKETAKSPALQQNPFY